MSVHSDPPDTTACDHQGLLEPVRVTGRPLHANDTFQATEGVNVGTASPSNSLQGCSGLLG